MTQAVVLSKRVTAVTRWPNAYAPAEVASALCPCIFLWGVTAAVVVAAFTLSRRLVPLVLPTYALCVLTDLVVTHRRALAYSSKPATTAMEIDLTATAERLPGGLPVALLPLLWLAALGAWAVFHLAASTPLLYRLAASALMCLMFAVMAWGVLHWSHRVSTSGEVAARERHFRRRVVTFILACEYFLVLPPTFDLLSVPRLAKLVWGAALFVVVGAFVLSLVAAGQGGTRRPEAAAGLPVGDHTSDAHWWWGLFYFNPADSVLLVEKRMGVGR